MDFKNNVTRLLDSRNVRYKVHLYDYDAGIQSAQEAAVAIGLPPERVFKTLVVLPDQPDRKPMLVVIPGPATLDLKSLAKVTKLKKAKMASHAEAENLTGLQAGGISPLALINRGFDVFLSDSARDFPTIAVSAGQRGANIELNVDDLTKLTRARLIAI